MQTFTDLVGTSAVPAHCFDSTELTDLAPALDTAAADLEMIPNFTYGFCYTLYTWGSCLRDEVSELAPALDTATATHDMAAEASEIRVTYTLTCWSGC